MTIKVGDRVRIKSWDKMVEQYGVNEDGVIDCKEKFVRNMEHLCGRTATVTDVKGNRITLDDWSDVSNTWWWSYSADMVESIEP